MTTVDSVLCYNRGCGEKFNLDQNNTDSCRHHPGVPVFHDALKGWSCCPKRTRDFTDFLNIPGCTNGPHSNEKPPEPEKSSGDTNIPDGEEVITVEPPQRPPLRNCIDRPSVNEPRIKLQATVGQSLKAALDRKKKTVAEKTADEEAGSAKVQVGTSCKNSGCNKCYENETSNVDVCNHHPGVPIFHEGMKYWSCCRRKTSDFNNFLAQAGCATGQHVWTKKDDSKKTAACRYDWHQTGNFVCISVFSKVTNPELTFVEVNQVSAFINIVFGTEESLFQQEFILYGVIDPSKSTVNLLGSKVEIKLKKADPVSWKTLEHKDE
ncbi:cysteine and histidine-rich domain-containing protein 1-like [Glandiceps talaboti]